MGAENSILGVIIAVLGLMGAVLVAWISRPREPRMPAELPATAGDDLSVSPQILVYFSGRIETLEGKVDHLTALVEQQTERVGFLERLLRTAMRIIRAQSRTLRKAGLPDEQIPAVLMPYSID